MAACIKIFNETIYISFTNTSKPNFYTVTLLTKCVTQVEVAFPNVLNGPNLRYMYMYIYAIVTKKKTKIFTVPQLLTLQMQKQN
jgi:hypothetical protein